MEKALIRKTWGSWWTKIIVWEQETLLAPQDTQGENVLQTIHLLSEAEPLLEIKIHSTRIPASKTVSGFSVTGKKANSFIFYK